MAREKLTGDTQGSKVGKRLQDIGGSVCGRTSGEKATAHGRERSSREEEHQRQELRGQNVPRNLKEQQGDQCVDCLTLPWGAGTSHVINTATHTVEIRLCSRVLRPTGLKRKKRGREPTWAITDQRTNKSLAQLDQTQQCDREQFLLIIERRKRNSNRTIQSTNLTEMFRVSQWPVFTFSSNRWLRQNLNAP